jgi:hypothetical protein
MELSRLWTRPERPDIKPDRLYRLELRIFEEKRQ